MTRSTRTEIRSATAPTQCVNVGGAQTTSDSSTLRFKFINNTVSGDDRFAFKGDFTLPAASRST
jgi:hypothetical protein